ncbi:hypothetical protein KCU90_g235, partial [Aureobasidium melanogenum]
MPKVRVSCCATNLTEKKGETNDLFALLGAVVGLVPGLIESAGLARALRDLRAPMFFVPWVSKTLLCWESREPIARLRFPWLLQWCLGGIVVLEGIDGVEEEVMRTRS